MCKNKKDLAKAIEQYRKAEALKKKAEADLDKLKADIIEYVLSKGIAGGKDNNSLVVVGDDYKISYIEVVKHPIDTDKVKEYFGDGISEYLKESISHRLDVR